MQLVFVFYLHLVLYAYAARFDVTDNLEKILVLGVN